MSEILELSDTREFSDASEESGLDNSRLNASLFSSPVPLEGLSDEHLEPSTEVSLDGLMQDLNNLTTSENMSSITSPPSGLFFNNSVSSLESSHMNCETQASFERLKKVLSELNDARAHWLGNEFLLKCCMESMEKLPKDIAVKMKDALLNAKVKQLPKLKSKTGQTFSILGLDEDDMESMGDSHDSFLGNNFSQLEINAIRRAVRNVAKSEIEKMVKRKSEMHAQFGRHCERVEGQSGVFTEDQEKLKELYRVVPQKIEQVVDQLIDINQLMQQLACPDESEQELRDKTYALLRDKAECLHQLTSYLRLKMDSQVLMDWKNVNAINEEGDKLKAQLAVDAKELKTLQNQLEEYQALENSSEEFREIVAEYNKVKKILQHKRQTLEMCADANYSFS